MALVAAKRRQSTGSSGDRTTACAFETALPPPSIPAPQTPLKQATRYCAVARLSWCPAPTTSEKSWSGRAGRSPRGARRRRRLRSTRPPTWCPAPGSTTAGGFPVCGRVARRFQGSAGVHQHDLCSLTPGRVESGQPIGAGQVRLPNPGASTVWRRESGPPSAKPPLGRYLSKFPAYPRSRRAVIPFLL